MRPPAAGTFTRDDSPTEVQSAAELADHVAHGTLHGLTILGLHLDVDLSAVRVDGALFVGCQFADRGAQADVVARGASVVPIFDQVPYPTTPSRLYTPTDLATGFDQGGFEAMYDTRVYRHYTSHGGPTPDVREALAQRLHDAGIDDALAEVSRGLGHRVVGIMGGHDVPRGDAAYGLAAHMAYELTAAGQTVVTGGGPGVMEAANLGAAAGSTEQLDDAIAQLARAPDFHDCEPYTAAAVRVGLTGGGLAIPTWLYGHEPVNLFAGQIAKYFSNALREDTILRLSRGGIVFAPGRAGTVQEVFQAANMAFYHSEGPPSPLVFLDSTHWTQTVPVLDLLRPLLAASPFGDATGLIRVTDDVYEAVALLARA